MNRRTFLAISGLGLASCARPQGVKPLVRTCRALPRVSASASDAELRERFLALECLTAAALVQSADEALFKDVERRFWELHALLSARPLTRRLAEAWRRFYGLTSRMHEVRNRRARRGVIPVYAYNGHHHAARLWLDETVRRGPRGPLLHFDSHHDMRELIGTDQILAARRRLEQGGRARKAALRRLRRLINDPATPVTAGVLGQAVDEVIWAAPSWSQVRPFSRRQLLYASVDRGPGGWQFALLHDPAAEGRVHAPLSGALPWAEVDELSARQRRALRHERPILLSFLETYPRGRRTQPELEGALGPGRFILDIDLDYFLTMDSASGFERRDPHVIDRMRRLQRYEHRLRIARQLVDARLGELEALLVDLRRAGRLPSMITLADSTYRPFSPLAAGTGHWEYMPYEFAAYTHWNVRRLLARVYRQDGVVAGV